MSLLWKSAQRTEHVPAEDLPTHPEPNGVSDQDHPRDYMQSSDAWRQHLGGTYSLQDVPLADLHRDHHHDANCYLPTDENRSRHDVADDDYEGENYDHKYVKEMAKDVDRLPLLLGRRTEDGSINYFGGGHRSAAHAEAGRSHIRMWLKD